MQVGIRTFSDLMTGKSTAFSLSKTHTTNTNKQPKNIKSAIGVFGVAGLDRLLCFMIVKEMQSLIGGLRSMMDHNTTQFLDVFKSALQVTFVFLCWLCFFECVFSSEKKNLILFCSHWMRCRRVVQSCMPTRLLELKNRN
jgi:hypothetical protein